MTFIWPFMLFTLAAVPLLVLLYLQVQRRRQGQAAGFQRASEGVPARKKAGARRHIPPILFLLGLVILLVALARPQAEVQLPRVEGTVILLFDISGSMAADDVEPSRIEAAKLTAQEFVLSQPETVQIGIVSFSGNGFAVQMPTNDTQSLLAAIARLEPQTGTSLGHGIVSALNTIAADAGLEPPELPAQGEAGNPELDRPQDAQSRIASDRVLLELLPQGPYPPAVIVILSDGEHNMSIDPIEAAQAAADRGVRVDALGFGTTAGTVLEIEGFSVHTALDEGILQAITQAAGGNYYNAQNEQDPQAVFANLTPRLVVKPEKMELTPILSGASILMVVVGALFSMLWFNRLP